MVWNSLYRDEGGRPPRCRHATAKQEDGPPQPNDQAPKMPIVVLDNALGYVLNQGGTAHFSPDNAKAYDFSLDYAVVTFARTLSGVQAKGFSIIWAP
jgi:hypothetical protein